MRTPGIPPRWVGWSSSSVRFRIEKWGWMVFVPIAFFTGWVNSVAVVSLLSIYALVISAAGAEQAAEAKEASRVEPE